MSMMFPLPLEPTTRDELLLGTFKKAVLVTLSLLLLALLWSPTTALLKVFVQLEKFVAATVLLLPTIRLTLCARSVLPADKASNAATAKRNTMRYFMVLA